MPKKKFDERKLVSFLLRIGLATVFLYAGVAVILNPLGWAGFIPVWASNILPENVFLPLHAALDIVIGIWLISGKRLFYASAAASLTLLFIVVFNIEALDIIFRDIALLFSAVALMLLHYKEVK